MPKRGKQRTINCAVCKREHFRSEYSLAAKWIKEYHQMHWPRLMEQDKEIWKESLTSNSELPCDNCLRQGKAIQTSPKAIIDSSFAPYYWYDEDRTCIDCKVGFVFSKEKQRHWYQALQFATYSKPVRCDSCQRKNRQMKDSNQRLNELLSKEVHTTEELEEIASIYDSIGNEEKRNRYRNLASKSNPK